MAEARNCHTGGLNDGYYAIDITTTGSYPNLYRLSMIDNGSSTIDPDRFESNNGFRQRAEITYEASAIGREKIIGGLNFHVTGDDDYFELVLPAISSPLKRGELSIWVSGTSWSNPSDISIFDDGGVRRINAIDRIVIENTIRYSPSNRLKFCVFSRHNRRNFYQIHLIYEEKRIELVPAEPLPDFSIPDRHAFVHIYKTLTTFSLYDKKLSSAWNVHPAHPAIALDLVNGKIDQVPVEYQLLHWDKTADITIEYNFISKQGNALNIILKDVNGRVIAHDRLSNEKKRQRNIEFTKVISAPKVKPGLYYFEVSGKRRHPLRYKTEIQ